MGLLGTLRWLNTFAIPNEKANAVAVAFSALVAIFAIHETLESFIASADAELTSQSVASFLILRSHSSFSSMLSHCRHDPLDPQGIYHRSDCRCAERGTDTLPDEYSCNFKNNGSPVMPRILIKANVLRAFLILVEILFVCLALTTSHEAMLPNGRYAFTVHGNNFGTPVNFSKNADKLGCVDFFTDSGISARSQNINRITQLVKCVFKLRPASVANASAILAQPPQGFSTFLFDLHLSGDKGVITDLNKTRYGADMYMYWKSHRRLVEGSVPVVSWGRNYSNNRLQQLSSSDLAMWRKAVDQRLRNVLKGAYRTAYGRGTRKWDEPNADVARMVMYIKWDSLPPEITNKGEKEAMGRLLNKLVVLQKTEASSNFSSEIQKIWYSEGTDIRKKGPVVEYIVTAPILGLVPWIILVIATMITRTMYSWWRPNRFFELWFNCFRTFTPAPYGPVRNVTPGKLIFTPNGLFFVQEMQEERRFRDSERKTKGNTYHVTCFPRSV